MREIMLLIPNVHFYLGAKIFNQFNKNLHVVIFEETCTNIWKLFKENMHSPSAQNPQGKCRITCLCKVCFTI